MQALSHSPALLDRWVLPSDSPALLDQWVQEDRYERTERELVRRYIKPHHRVLEVGAGVGVVTRTLLSEVKAAAVWAYEPQPAAYACLVTNLGRMTTTPGQQVALFQAAVGVGVSTLTLNVNSEFWNTSPLSTPPPYGEVVERVKVECVDVATVIRTGNLNAVVMDCEGGEHNLLPALANTGVEVVVVETHPYLGGGPLRVPPEYVPVLEIAPTPECHNGYGVWVRGEVGV